VLYLDSSALIKVYLKEIGSEAVIARAISSDEVLCTSVLAFAEVLGAFARRYREQLLTSLEFVNVRELFQRDWSMLLNVIELNIKTMAALPKLMEEYPLKSADAIHLSTAIWLNRTMQSEMSSRVKDVLEFGVADRILAKIAGDCGLRIFNPEEQN
jgi:predicted nucleic acid-binding protein